METLNIHSGEFQLERLPKIKNDTLRGWDAADELLIETVLTDYSHLLVTPPLIANDSFGALALAFNEYSVHSWSDSFISHLATTHNLSLNKISASPVLIPSTKEPEGKYDLVLIKIPKTLSLLEDQLCRLKPHIHPETVIIGAAMSKHIHTSTLKLFEKIIGTTTTSRATKKARLIYAQNDQQNIVVSPYPKTIKDESSGINLQNFANVFANDHLDIGTRFFLETIKKHLNQHGEYAEQAPNIIDLGCGNGILGIAAKQLIPHAKISFTDESYAAIASAKINYSNETIDENTDDAEFVMSNSLDQFQGNAPDLILCNPPFHQAHAVGDHIAWTMFKQSQQKLQKNGELWVVGNRHLAYHIKLKKLFGNCQTVASNKKFVILVATKNKK
ncbi:methyltransferase [Cocleimonas sp. KMM 6892]|uniref:methyltransferase n=1 Tax=unclassified Cocleimonas TaxID=2639732 RepID=UPI002DBDD641|nr:MULTISPECIES: methyltransferase [unclassified Cocleimonas]MEB8433647.1 methyltransferase [Cocleimonas sp. KMM 6892]MEC4716458.1 methyltransferase [Cocleimonas sp. KMM 6895]MEC4745649.1 methyltransferase [Cocleimonas sp. KMM 6896]